MDASITPGDDFFAYANGGWLKATAIPAGKERWGARDELEEETRRRIAALVNAATPPAPRRAGSAARKVADFHAAYLNEAAIEARGLASLKPLLDPIEKVSDKAELTRLLGRGLRADVDPMGFGIYKSAGVLGLSVEQSIHGEKTNTAFLVQGGLGLPDREDYLSADPGKEALRARYREYIRTMLTLAGLGRADERASAVLALETAIAQSQGTREASANDHNADQRVDAFRLRAAGPRDRLDRLLRRGGVGRAGRVRRLAAGRRDRVGGAGRVAAAGGLEGLPALPCHPRFRGRAAARICRAGAGAACRHGGAATAVACRARARCHAIGHEECAGEDVRRALFPRRAEGARGANLRQRPRGAHRRVEAATWMSPATRASALSKLQTLYVGIGYPDQWEDDSSLTVDPADPLGNLRRVSDRAYRNAVARLGQPVNLKYWYISPQTVGALLVFQQNAYVMSAALLEPPKYDHASSDAAAYGSVGALIGHDLTHYIDVLGADYDTEHRMRHWWTPRTCSASRLSRGRWWISSRRTSRSPASRSTAS